MLYLYQLDYEFQQILKKFHVSKLLYQCWQHTGHTTNLTVPLKKYQLFHRLKLKNTAALISFTIFSSIKSPHVEMISF